jgi:hypothetical protein
LQLGERDFFVQDSAFLAPGFRSGGEVPKEFRTRPISVVVLLRGMPGMASRVLGSGITTAISMRTPVDADFVPIADDVLLDPGSAPGRSALANAVGRVQLPPLPMQKSNSVARKTLLRVDVRAGRKLLRSKTASLGTLLWESEERDLDVDCERRRGRRRLRPDVEMRVEKFNSFQALAGSNVVEVCASVSSALRAETAGKRLTFSISRSSKEASGWTPVFRSEILGAMQKNGFIPAELSRESLLGRDDDRVLRIALHTLLPQKQRPLQDEDSMSSLIARRTLGFADVELARTKSSGRSLVLSWRIGNGFRGGDGAVRHAPVLAALEMKFMEQPGGITKISLAFKQARQVKPAMNASKATYDMSNGKVARMYSHRASVDLVRSEQLGGGGILSSRKSCELVRNGKEDGMSTSFKSLGDMSFYTTTS